MASHMFYNAFVSVNSQDLSDHAKTVTINYGAAQLDDAAMGDLTEINMAGIKVWSVSIEFDQDYAASKVDATHFSLVGAAKFPIVVRSDAGVKSVTNPEFGGDVILTNYPPVGGTHGDKHRTTAEFACAGTLGRETS